MPIQNMKKIFFMRIAKTAGSAFNLFLKKNFVGEAHCERYLIPNTNKFSKIEHLKSLDYVSGHLRLPVFQENNFSNKEYFLLAFLREPVAQLISHLNWVMHIKDINPKFF
jgi:hypothetical protein